MTTRAVRPFAMTVALAAITLLAACESAPISKETQGQIIGGATGAAVGSLFGGGTGRIVATGVGAVAGSIVGGEVAKGM